MSEPITFIVLGRPQQRGSKRALPIGGKSGGRIILVDDNKRSVPWMACVRATAFNAYVGDLLDGPLCLTARFFFARPQSHYGAKGVKASAPRYHAQTPDLSKLLRALEDGLSGIVWRDDRLVTQYGVTTGKYWTTEQERCEVVIERLEMSNA